MNRKAFTLIELLVVVAIIGILAAVGVVAYNGYTSAAKKNTTEANHKLIVKYIQNEWQRCEIGETTVMPLNGANQLTCSSGLINALMLFLCVCVRSQITLIISSCFGINVEFMQILFSYPF